ncbi:hypothetical protein GJ496_007395 [Pomphorhynchus laevis]|nr:hypothetical protein GJ496_007395 [Pomphorhynchus laevis]
MRKDTLIIVIFVSSLLITGVAIILIWLCVKKSQQRKMNAANDNLSSLNDEFDNTVSTITCGKSKHIAFLDAYQPVLLNKPKLVKFKELHLPEQNDPPNSPRSKIADLSENKDYENVDQHNENISKKFTKRLDSRTYDLDSYSEGTDTVDTSSQNEKLFQLMTKLDNLIAIPTDAEISNTLSEARIRMGNENLNVRAMNFKKSFYDDLAQSNKNEIKNHTLNDKVDTPSEKHDKNCGNTRADVNNLEESDTDEESIDCNDFQYYYKR